MQNSTSTSPRPARVVLFMTHERAADVPGEDTRLACLLPLGTASFAERVMDSCALAGVRQLDVVVSEHPEVLRAILQDGAPWGIQLRWHHAKESASPYTVFRGMGLVPQEHVVIGHAHQWVGSRIVRDLMQTSGVAMQVSADVVWTGWFSANEAALLSDLGQHEDYSSLGERARRLEGARCVIAAAADFAQNLCATDLLAAQKHSLDGTQEAAVPASWLRMPWGAASPDAVIDANAQIHGPVLIGAGCVVEAGAELGPATVLAHDVFIASGARVRQSLVMANTYVGGQIALDNALAQGNSIQSLKWSVRTVLSPQDALMVPLRSKATPSTPWTSRLLAALVAVVLLPLMLPALMLQRLLTGHVLWCLVQAVQSSVSGQDGLLHQTVRQPHSRHAADRWVGHYGALLDIAQGRRNWFGLRPRAESEWYALGRDWQELFSHTAIGLFHAPAWSEDGDNLASEVYAAADAFMAVQTTMLGRFRILYTQTWRNR
jgi:mannose-1-phosphate guanylyltransferase / phosphomannomutase